MDPAEVSRRSLRVRHWLAVAVLVALAVGVATGVQSHWLAIRRGQDGTLATRVAAQVIASLAWIPIGYLITLVSQRFPLRRAAWRRPLLVHTLGAAATSFAVNALIGTGWWLAGIPQPGGAVRHSLDLSLAYLHINALIYCLIVASVHVVGREVRRARLEAQLSQARLDALRAQINPHFLFNALHTLGMLWRTGRPDAAQATLERLGTLLRRMLDEGPHEVTLSEEVDFVMSYLEIEKLRLGDRLRIELDIPAELASARIPALLLQPLVENAVRHGVAPNSRPGWIRVSATATEGRLTLSVADSGAGSGVAAPSAGTGLTNVRRRLEALYPGAHELRISVAPEAGWVVTLVLPRQ